MISVNEINVNESVYVKFHEPYVGTLLGGNKHPIKVVIVGTTLLSNIKTYDPYKVIYETVGLSKADYEEHLKNNVLIVEMKDCKGIVYRVPATAINFYSKEELVEYANMATIVALGLQKVDFDFTNMEEEIREVVVKYTGVRPDIKTIITSNIIGLSKKDSDTITTIRNSNKGTSIVLREQEATEQLHDCREKTKQLEKFIVDCSVNGCP